MNIAKATTQSAQSMAYKTLGKENAPWDLLPFQVQRAKELIEKKRRAQ
jgi:hypothetical protein